MVCHPVIFYRVHSLLTDLASVDFELSVALSCPLISAKSSLAVAEYSSLNPSQPSPDPGSPGTTQIWKLQGRFFYRTKAHVEAADGSEVDGVPV